MKNKIRNTMNALMARQRELNEIMAMCGLSTEQAVEHAGNNFQLYTLAKKLA